MGRLVLLIGEDFKLLAQRSAVLMKAGFASAPVQDLAQAVSYLKKARFDACVIVQFIDPPLQERVESLLKAEQPDLPVLWVEHAAEKSGEFAESVRRAIN
jgi:hypothetical protein